MEDRLGEVVGPARPLRIGLIAPPWVPVPPTVYGGTELVLDELAVGLVRAGCDVVLMTTGDSTCPVARRWLLPRALGTVDDPAAEVEHVAWAYGELGGVDLIHDHTLWGPHWAAAHPGPIPVVTTIHGELTPKLRRHYAEVAAAGVDLIAISHAQRRSAPELPFADVIHHGIATDRIPVGDGRGGYVAFLGRMHPDKGAHRAIEVARAAGKRILLAAKMWEPIELRYFAERIEPLLGPDVVYVGEVGRWRKHLLLGSAEALVNPILWPEPFGLVMIESLACGTPVLAFPQGAAPEIVEHGRSGFLCADEAEMVAALARVGDLDRAACRARAEERFSSEQMVRAHVHLYERLIDGQSGRPRDDDGFLSAAT